MAQTLIVAGKLTHPDEDGQAAAPISLDSSWVFTQKAAFDRVYDGALADDPIDFGTLVTAGAKLILIKCPIGSCTFKFMSGMTTGNIIWTLQPGGYFLFNNPAQGGPTGCKVTVTGAATVKFLAVG